MNSRSYALSLEDIKKVHADWHGASANGLTSDALAALIEIAEVAEHVLESLVERDWLEDGSILPHPALETLRQSLTHLKGK